MSTQKRFTRWVPLLLIFIALACVIYFRWYEYLSFSALQAHHSQLRRWTDEHYAWVALGYMLIYLVAVALSVPGAVFLTLAGGYLFGIFAGTVYVVISATIGACLLFLAVKTALGEWLEGKVGGWLRKMEKGFQENAMSYLLFLRLVPLFPFWVVNIVAAVLGVRFRVFLTATFFGIIPGAAVYVAVGNDLNHLLKVGQTPDLQIVFQPEVLLPLIALAVLSLVPLLYKLFKKRSA